MKKTTLLLAAILFSNFFALAQKEFTMDWKMNFPVSPDSKLINDDATLVLEGDNTEIAMIDAVAGKVLWQTTFKEKFGIKKSKVWSWNEYENVIEFVFKGESKNEEKIIYVDGKTGNILNERKELKTKTETPVREKKIKTKMKWNGSYDDAERGFSLDVHFEKSLFIAAYDSKKKREITVKCSGSKSWSQTVKGNYVSDLFTNAAGSMAGMYDGIYIDVSVIDDKVFLIYEGISVLDLNTGKVLWETTFDNSDFNFGLFKSTQTLGRAAMPLASKSGVFIADLSDKNFKIKKFDISNGTLLWESEKFDNDDVVPQLEIVGNVLLARFGGTLEVQAFMPGTNGNPDRWTKEFKMVGNKGIKAYDISTGKLIWETFKNKELSDKFGGAITNLISDEKYAYVASDKNLFAFDASNGKPKYVVPLGKLKIDKPSSIETLNGNFIIEASEGIASIAMADGKVNFGTNTGKCFGTFTHGDAYFVWTGKDAYTLNKFVRLDLVTGKIYGKMDDTFYPYFSSNGDAFVKFDGSKILRFKTK